VARALLGAAALALASLALAGCGGLAAKAPKTPVRGDVQSVADVSAQVAAAQAEVRPTLIEDSIRRKAEKMTLRIRNTGCEGVAIGSSFALDRHTLLTNRHVLAGADVLEAETWDGRTLQVPTAEVGALVDLGVVTTDATLPAVARFGPAAKPGQQVTVVGFPLGGRQTFSRGYVIDYVEGRQLGIPGKVMRLTANVLPGNSGGPVIDKQGRVVGIVYAIETATGDGLAIPLGTLRSLLKAGGLQDVPPCGSE
jgi:S1-C subfamily serine protease